MKINQNWTLTMSNKEANRISVLDRLNRKEIKQKSAAEILGLSIRQIKRLIKIYRKVGVSGLTHGNRGKSSNCAIKQVEINNVLEIIKNNYVGFGPTLAHEKLTETNKISFSVETLRKAMINAGLWTDKKRKKMAIHQLRERRKCFGELVQIDGSPHRWFEDRGEAGTLLVFIDDATSTLLWLEFCHSETTLSYFKATKGYLLKYGKPLSFYSDRDSVFRTNFKGNNFYEPTQFTRAMGELSIKVICATTPQAKGRVERANQTLQDRLVKELRLRGINNIKEANEFMPEFMDKFNQKFAVTPINDFNAHRPLTPIETLKINQILVVIEERVLSKNLTCQLNGQIYQIKTNNNGYALRKARIKIIKDSDNQTWIEYNHRKLDYTIAPKGLLAETEIIGSKLINPKIDTFNNQATTTILASNRKPAMNHPWRQYHLRDEK